VYRFDRPPLDAVVNPAAYLFDKHAELMTMSGVMQTVTYSELKALCFVSEPGVTDLFTRHNLFERRPKVAGLWTRFTFRDGDRLDGILSHNLLDWPEAGYLLTPPRAGATRQRVFVPRPAVTQTELRGVVGRPAGLPVAQGKRPGAEPEDQLNMFD
jgi:hypothetical protein